MDMIKLKSQTRKITSGQGSPYAIYIVIKIRGTDRIYFGTASDQPIPIDHDGSETSNVRIFRDFSGLWAIRGVSRLYFGQIGDQPVTR